MSLIKECKKKIMRYNLPEIMSKEAYIGRESIRRHGNEYTDTNCQNKMSNVISNDRLVARSLFAGNQRIKKRHD